jgi:hypothetical protein
MDPLAPPILDDGVPHSPIAALRRLARPRPPEERCELCAAPLAPEHQHLLEPANRQLHCACDACAVLFSDTPAGKFRRVPRRIESWPAFKMADLQWESLGIPINLAFFVRHSSTGQIMALYPSPGGATESLLAADAWQGLVDENPALARLEPDVEALLVNRVRDAREHYRAPIDECYKLVGLIRAHWRGLYGGKEAWTRIERFFDELKARSVKASPHA